MAGEPGIEVPFSIGADGAVVTLETLAAKVLELEDAVKKAGKATEDAIGQKTSLKAKVLDGVFFSIGNTVTNKVIGAVERLSSIVTGLPSVFADLVQTGDKLADMALQFNTTAESLQQLEAAGVPVGVTMEQIVRSMNLVDRTMSSSGEKFRKYGLDVDSLAKLDTAQRFEAIATKLHAIEDPAKQAAASFELLKDRSGAMLKIIRQAPEEFAKSRKELEDYGLIISGKTVAALDEFGEKQQKLGKVWEGVQQNLVAVVAESKPLQEALQVSIELIGSLSKWVADNQKELLDWVNFGVLYAVEALTMMTRALPIVIDAFSGMRVMLSVVKTGFDGITASVSFAVDAFMLLNEIQTKGLTESADAAKRLKERVSDFAVEMSNLSVKGNAEIRKINKQNAELQDGADVVLSKAEKLRRRIVDSSKNADFALPGQKKSAGETGPSQEDLTRQTKYLENAQKIASIEAQVSGILASRSGGQAVADATLAAAEKAANLQLKSQETSIQLSLKQGTIDEEAASRQLGFLRSEYDAQKQLRDLQFDQSSRQEDLRQRQLKIDEAKSLYAVEQQLAAINQGSLTDVEKILAARDQSVEKAQTELDVSIASLQFEREALGLTGQRATENKLAQILAKEAFKDQVKIADATRDAAFKAREFAFAMKYGTENVDAARAKAEELATIMQAVNDPTALISEADLAALDEAVEKAIRLGASMDVVAGASANADAAFSRLMDQKVKDATNSKTIARDVEQTIILSRAESERLEIQRKIVKEKLRARAITADEAERLFPGIISQALSLKNVLGLAADTMLQMGINAESTLGKLSAMVSQMFRARQAGEAAAAAWKSGDKLQALASGAGALTDIWNSNRQTTKGQGALSGATKGAAFGSAFGPWGTLAGGVVGGIAGLFSGSAWRKASKEAGKVLGVEASKELTEKIQADAKKLKITIKASALLNLGNAISESGKPAAQFATQIGDLMKGIADKSIPAQEGIESLGSAFSAVAEDALKAGTVGDRVLTKLIKQSRELKIDSPEIKAFVGGQVDKAVAGIQKFSAAFEKLSTETVTKLGDNAAISFGAVFDALVSEKGITAAVEELGGAFESLRGKLADAIGTEATSKLLAPFSTAFDTISNEKLKPIFEGIDGLSQAMQGLANSAYLSLDQFTAMQDATATLFDEAVSGGADMRTALQAVAPSIQAAISAAEQFGVPIDADTQRLKDLAEQNGITFKTDPQFAMLEVLTSIAEVLGADIPESARKAIDAMMGLLASTPGEIKVAPGDSGGVVRGGNVTQVTLNLNENPLASAETAEQMRRQTIGWVEDAVTNAVMAAAR